LKYFCLECSVVQPRILIQAGLLVGILLAAACADARVRLNDLLNAIPVLQRNIDQARADQAARGMARRVGDRMDSTGDDPGRAAASHGWIRSP